MKKRITSLALTLAVLTAGLFFTPFDAAADEITAKTSAELNFNTIATGYAHNLVIKNDGSLWAWGGNYAGQLGNGTNIDSNIPIRVGDKIGWQAVSAKGNAFSVALDVDGNIWTWGLNNQGQLGDGLRVNRNVPNQITQDISGLIEDTLKKALDELGYGDLDELIKDLEALYKYRNQLENKQPVQKENVNYFNIMSISFAVLSALLLVALIWVLLSKRPRTTKVVHVHRSKKKPV